MIGIQYKGEFFDLAPGEKIVVEWISTLFNDEETFAGSYSYPALAPFSEKNKRLLGYADQLQNRNARNDIDVILFVFGQSWKRCKCSFSISKTGFKLVCKIDNGEFAKLIKELELPQLFIDTEGGVFRDWKYETVGLSPQDVNEKMVDSARNPGKYPWVFPSYKNDDLFGNFDGEANQQQYENIHYFNQYFPADGYRAPLEEGHIKSRFFTPFFYLRWVVQQMCGFLGFVAEGDFFIDERTKGILIDNTGVAGLKDLFEKPSGFRIKVAYHLPKIKVADLIKKLRCEFKMGIYFDPNERIAYFRYAPEVLRTSEIVDISGKTTPDYEEQDQPPEGYEIIQATDEKDDIFKLLTYTRTFLIGGDIERKKVDNFIGTSFMTKKTEERPGSTGTWRIPRRRQVGNAYTANAIGSQAYIEGTTDYAKNQFSLRLLNYRGMRVDTAGVEYPYASSDDLEPNEQYTDCPISLWLGGERGILASYQKDWYIFYLRTEQIELTAHLPFSILNRMSPLKRISWVTKEQTKAVGLFNKVSFEAMNDQELIKALVSVYPNYNQAATDEPVYTEFKPAEEINPGGLYAKAYVNNRLEIFKEQRSWFLGKKKKILTDVYLDLVMDFYSDKECTQPKQVDNIIAYFKFSYSSLITNPAGIKSGNFGNPQITPGKITAQNYDVIKPEASDKKEFTATGARFIYRLAHYHSDDNITWTMNVKAIQPPNADYILVE